MWSSPGKTGLALEIELLAAENMSGVFAPRGYRQRFAASGAYRNCLLLGAVGLNVLRILQLQADPNALSGSDKAQADEVRQWLATIEVVCPTKGRSRPIRDQVLGNICKVCVCSLISLAIDVLYSGKECYTSQLFCTTADFASADLMAGTLSGFWQC